jgi:hypothetical protein
LFNLVKAFEKENHLPDDNEFLPSGNDLPDDNIDVFNATNKQTRITTRTVQLNSNKTHSVSNASNITQYVLNSSNSLKSKLFILNRIFVSSYLFKLFMWKKIIKIV